MVTLFDGLQITDSSLFLIILVSVIVAGLLIALYVWWIGRAVLEKPLTGSEALLGKKGIALKDITEAEGGEVNIEGTIWRAKLEEAGAEIRKRGEALSPTEEISKGDAVVVVGVSALSVIIKKVNKGDEQT